MKPPTALPDRVGGDAEEEADRDCREHVAGVVRTGNDDLSETHDAAARTGRGEATAGAIEARDVVSHDPPIPDADAAGSWRAAPVEHGARDTGRCEGRADRILGVEHKPSTGGSQLGQATLGGSVGLNSPVPV